MKILITGSAGFIGFHAVQEFSRRGWDVIGVDNFSDYYDVQLKRDREAMLSCLQHYMGIVVDICDHKQLREIFLIEEPDVVLNLAAQPGVRYSITNPFVYQKTNIEGFLNVLECCRYLDKKPKLVFASSSSVYGNSVKMPFEEHDTVAMPVSLYAATKRANELMAYTYAHLYKIQTIGLRPFTAYGDWYRPDMALSLFAASMLQDKPIKVFNNGDMRRDFTYIDDVVDGIVRVVDSDRLPLYDIFNIGNNQSENLMDVIETLALALGVSPKMEMLPMQIGDVYATYSSIDKLSKAVGYEPKTNIAKGIPIFAEWHRRYYNHRKRLSQRQTDVQ